MNRSRTARPGCLQPDARVSTVVHISSAYQKTRTPSQQLLGFSGRVLNTWQEWVSTETVNITDVPGLAATETV